jgi:hypothetical protein
MNIQIYTKSSNSFIYYRPKMSVNCYNGRFVTNAKSLEIQNSEIKNV